MAGVMDELMEQLSGAGGPAGVGGLLGGLLGGDATGHADPDTAAKTEAASKAGLEAILGGLAKNAQSTRGAKSLEKALQRHDGSVLDDLPSTLGSLSNTADGEKILGHVFGKNQPAVTQHLAATSGLDAGSIAKLLPMLAPVVMGMLAKKGAGSKGAGGLAGMLGGEAGGLDLGDLAGMLGDGTGARSGLGGLGGLGGVLKSLLGR